jgi:hypothetical protein
MGVREQFWITVIDKNRSQAQPQKQKRQRPQLLHAVHSMFSFEKPQQL